MEPEIISPAQAFVVDPEELYNDPTWIVERKFDGSRYLMHFHSNHVHFLSRRISSKNGKFVEKTKNVPHLIPSKKKIRKLCGTIIDGEIISQSGKFSDVVSIMGSTSENSIEKQKELGKPIWMVFDILFVKGIDVRNLPLSKRKELLKNFVDFVNNEYIKFVEYKTDNKKEFLEGEWKEDREGIILKNLNSTYYEGWIKVKRIREDSAFICGYVNSDSTSFQGLVGSIIFGQYDENGNVIEVSKASGFDESVRIEISNNREKYLGKVADIRYQEKTKHDRFRHPRFLRWRPDLDKKQCIFKRKNK